MTECQPTGTVQGANGFEPVETPIGSPEVPETAPQPQIYPDVFFEEHVVCEETVSAVIPDDSENIVLHGDSLPEFEVQGQEEIEVATRPAPETILASEVVIEENPTGFWSGRIASFIATQIKQILGKVKIQRAQKRLRVCESVSLGEKRFLAVVQVDGEEFLVGGAANSISTLARLERNQEFSELLKHHWAEDAARA